MSTTTERKAEVIKTYAPKASRHRFARGSGGDPVGAHQQPDRAFQVARQGQPFAPRPAQNGLAAPHRSSNLFAGPPDSPSAPPPPPPPPSARPPPLPPARPNFRPPPSGGRPPRRGQPPRRGAFAPPGTGGRAPISASSLRRVTVPPRTGAPHEGRGHPRRLAHGFRARPKTMREKRNVRYASS